MRIRIPKWFLKHQNRANNAGDMILKYTQSFQNELTSDTSCPHCDIPAQLFAKQTNKRGLSAGI